MHFNIAETIKSKLPLLTTLVLMFIMLFVLSTKCIAEPDYEIGSIIKFGSYYQNDLSQKTPIQWKILDIQDGKALLISKSLLDAQNYHNKYIEVTWENSSIRSWLNNEFMSEAFNKEEQDKIEVTDLPNPNNSEYSTNGGNDTKDKIFLLSIDEIEKYFHDDKDRECKVTKYAEKQGVRAYDGYGFWWLRTPGNNNDTAAVIFSNGHINDHGYGVNNNNNAVRPALFINIK